MSANDSENSTCRESLPSFPVKLYPDNNSEANFRTENDPSNLDQRENVIHRKGLVYINCDFKDIAHGYYSRTSDDLSSLVVLYFRFEPLYNSHRIKHVNIEVKFSGILASDFDPVVKHISLDGHFGIQPTTQSESVTHGVGASVGYNLVSAQVSREKTTEQKTTDMATVQGFRDTVGRNYGKKNAACWILRENNTTKTGVPTSMQTAILLERTDMSRFQAHFTIRVKLDTIASALSAFRSDPRDHPVFFNPQLDATSNLKEYDTDALGEEDIEALSNVHVITVLDGTMKLRGQ
ncbi:hypothetical protein V8C43DRAFT_274333 [Trichoderma afarasin]